MKKENVFIFDSAVISESICIYMPGSRGFHGGGGGNGGPGRKSLTTFFFFFLSHRGRERGGGPRQYS